MPGPGQRCRYGFCKWHDLRRRPEKKRARFEKFTFGERTSAVVRLFCFVGFIFFCFPTRTSEMIDAAEKFPFFNRIKWNSRAHRPALAHSPSQLQILLLCLAVPAVRLSARYSGPVLWERVDENQGKGWKRRKNERVENGRNGDLMKYVRTTASGADENVLEKIREKSNERMTCEYVFAVSILSTREVFSYRSGKSFVDFVSKHQYL